MLLLLPLRLAVVPVSCSLFKSLFSLAAPNFIWKFFNKLFFAL